MAQAVLLLSIQLRHTLAKFRQPEQGVITKAPLAQRRFENLPLPAALNHQRHRIIGMTQVDQSTPVATTAGLSGYFSQLLQQLGVVALVTLGFTGVAGRIDRKSTRLNSSHVRISYAVFCLKKKKNTKLAQQLD